MLSSNSPSAFGHSQACHGQKPLGQLRAYGIQPDFLSLLRLLLWDQLPWLGSSSTSSPLLHPWVAGQHCLWFPELVLSHTVTSSCRQLDSFSLLAAITVKEEVNQGSGDLQSQEHLAPAAARLPLVMFPFVYSVPAHWPPSNAGAHPHCRAFAQLFLLKHVHPDMHTVHSPPARSSLECHLVTLFEVVTSTHSAPPYPLLYSCHPLQPLPPDTLLLTEK